MEASFPRGKLAASSASQLQQQRPAASGGSRLFSSHTAAAADRPERGKRGASQDPSAGNKSKQANRSKSAASSRSASERTGAGGPSLCDELSFKRARVGTVVLCRVKRVTATRAVLSLPHGLTAYCGVGDVNAVLRQACEASMDVEPNDADADDDADLNAASSSRRGVFSVLHPGQFVIGTITRVGDESLFKERSAASALSQSLSASRERNGIKTGDHRLTVSLQPELANQGVSLEQLRTGSLVCGYVRSVEDHGFVVETGVAGVTAFLPFANTDGTAGQVGSQLSRALPGSPVMCVVTAVNRVTHVLTLSSNAAAVAAAVSDEPTHTIYTLKPGMRVTATIDRTLDNGLAVSFLAFFHATVHVAHLPLPAHAQWAAEFTPGAQISARVLYVNAAEKVIALSAAPHVVELGGGGDAAAALVAPPPPPTPAAVAAKGSSAATIAASAAAAAAVQPCGGPSYDVIDGSVVESAIVLRVDPDMGMLIGWGGSAAAQPKQGQQHLQLQSRLRASAQWGRTAYVHISRIDDGARVSNIERTYRPGTAVRARVVGFAGIEGQAIASTKPSVVDAAVLRVTDVKPGAVLQGVVETVLVDVGTLSSSHGASDGKKPAAQPDFIAGKGVVAVIKLGEGVTGVIPALHVADALPSASFRNAKARAAFMKGVGVVEGAKLSVRVLSVDTLSGRIQLSLKKSIVTSTLPALTTYEGAYKELKAAAAAAGAGASSGAPATEADGGDAVTSHQLGGSKASSTSSGGALLAHGCVTGFREHGIIVTFFDGISGLLPVSDLLEHGVLRADVVKSTPAPLPAPPGSVSHTVPVSVLQSLYSLGQVVKVRVVSVAISKGKMKLSIGFKGTHTAPSAPAAATATAADKDDAESITSAPAAGSFVDGTVVETDAFHRRVIVRVTRITSSGGQEGSDVSASAPLYGELSEAHCTDAPCTATSEGSSTLPVVGTVMRDLLVLQHILAVTHHRSTLKAAATVAATAAPLASLLLTAKPTLRYAAKASSSSSSSASSVTLLPSSIAVLRPGLMLIGYVVQITAFGAFVRFLDACTGLAPRNRWPSTSSGASAIDGDHEHEPLVIGQTVACVVHSVNADTAAKGGRFALDLTPLALSRCLTPSLVSSSISESISPVCPLATAAAASAAALLRPRFSLAGLLQRGGMAAHEAAIVETADRVAAAAASSSSSSGAAVDADAARHVPTRAEYPIGRLCVVRIIEVSAPVSVADAKNGRGAGSGGGAAAAPAAQSAVVLMPPPLTAVPAGGVVESSSGSSSGAAVVFGFASCLRGPGHKAGQCVLARVLDIDLSRRVVLVEVLGGDVPPQLQPASEGKPQPKKSKGGRTTTADAAAAACAPRWVDSPSSAGVAPQQRRLALGDIAKVCVIHVQMGSPSTHFSASSRVAVVEVLTEGAAGTAAAAAPNPIGFAVLDDAFGSLLSRDAALAPGSVHEAIVTQVPLVAASGGGTGAMARGKRRREGGSSSSEKDAAAATIGNSIVPPVFAAEGSMDSMLLLSLVPTTREAKRQGSIKDAHSSSSSTAAAASRSGGGGRGATASVSVADLVTGMTVSAYTVPPRAPAASSTTAVVPSPISAHRGTAGAARARAMSTDSAVSGGAGARARAMSTDSTGTLDSTTAAPTTAAASSSAPSSRAVGRSLGVTEPLHLKLVGVAGRYDAQLSFAECAELDPFTLTAISSGSAAADAAAGVLQRYNEIREAVVGGASPPVQLRIVSITRELAKTMPLLPSNSSSSGSVGSSSSSSCSYFYRVALTARRSDVSLPDMHLASPRLVWAASDSSSSSAAPTPAAAAAAAATAPSLPSLVLSSSALVTTAVSAGTITSASPANPFTAAATTASAASHTPTRGSVCVGVVEGHAPDGSFVWIGLGGGVHAQCFVLECGDTDDVRDAVTGRLIPSSAVAAKLHLKGLRKMHRVGSIVPLVILATDETHRRVHVSIRRARAADAVARAAAAESQQQQQQQPPSERFTHAARAVSEWLARSVAAEAAPGTVALGRVFGSGGTSGAYPKTSTLLRLQLNADAAGAVCISHCGDRAAWRDRPCAGFSDGAIMLCAVLPASPSGAATQPTAAPASAAASSKGSAAAAAAHSSHPHHPSTPGLLYAEQLEQVELTLRPSWVQAAVDARIAAAAAATTAAAVVPNAVAAAATASKKGKKKGAAAAAAESTSPDPITAADAAASLALSSLERAEAAAVCTVGTPASAFVISVTPKGVFVRLGRDLTARVQLSKLSDGFVRNVGQEFPAGRLVTGIITAADASSHRIEMSLRKRDVSGENAAEEAAAAAAVEVVGARKRSTDGADSSDEDDEKHAVPSTPSSSLLGLGDLRAGMVFDGRITKVADFGVFIALEGTDRHAGQQQSKSSGGRGRGRGGARATAAPRIIPISGLCHVSELADPDPELAQEDTAAALRPSKRQRAISTSSSRIQRGALSVLYNVGDAVRAVIESCDAEAAKVALSMRPSKIEAADEGGSDGEDEGALADGDAEGCADDTDTDADDVATDEDDDDDSRGSEEEEGGASSDSSSDAFADVDFNAPVADMTPAPAAAASTTGKKPKKAAAAAAADEKCARLASLLQSGPRYEDFFGPREAHEEEDSATDSDDDDGDDNGEGDEGSSGGSDDEDDDGSSSDDGVPVAAAAASSKRAAPPQQQLAGGIYSAIDDDDMGVPTSSTRAASAPLAPPRRRPATAAAIATDVPDDRAHESSDEDSDHDHDDDAMDESGGGASSEDGNSGHVSRSAGKAQRKHASHRAAAAEEARISHAEARIASGEAEAHPETLEDYERLVASYPTSAVAWVRYMAWQVSVTEVDAARAVGARALTAIPIREETERLNVWTALLNLEYAYGDAKSLGRVFANAQAVCDPRAVHVALLEVYQRAVGAPGSGTGDDIVRTAEAEALFALTARKFGRELRGLWTSWAAFRFKRRDAAGARTLLKRAIEALPKGEHLRTMEAFAKLEYDNSGGAAGVGSQERGRTMFEGLVAAAPKALDVWSVYLDLEIAALARRSAAAAAAAGGSGKAAAGAAAHSAEGDVTGIRRIFDRVASLRQSSKKMKFLLKKYLEFEHGPHGDAGGVRHVQELARKYVAAQMGKAAVGGDGEE